MTWSGLAADGSSAATVVVVSSSGLPPLSVRAAPADASSSPDVHDRASSSGAPMIAARLNLTAVSPTNDRHGPTLRDVPRRRTERAVGPQNSWNPTVRGLRYPVET